MRKQINLDDRHEAMLKRATAASGLSESEIIRRALDLYIGGSERTPALNPAAWQEIEAFIAKRVKALAGSQQTRDWTREDIYEERMEQLARHYRK